MRLLPFALACLLAACGAGSTKHSAPEDTTTAMAPAATATDAAVAGKLGDPVCGMPYDTAYKEWSVYKTDTVHFCSPTCKGVFDKNPAKYAAKLGL